jgi:hypothetical protein
MPRSAHIPITQTDNFFRTLWCSFINQTLFGLPEAIFGGKTSTKLAKARHWNVENHSLYKITTEIYY